MSFWAERIERAAFWRMDNATTKEATGPGLNTYNLINDF